MRTREGQKRRRSEGGFSLLELVVASSILLVVMVGITRAFTAQHRTYQVVDQVTEAQQNLRAVADLLERDLRRAGYMVPPHAAVCAYDNTGAPDVLFVSNAGAIRTVFDLEDENQDLTPNKGVAITNDDSNSGFNATGSALVLNVPGLWVDYEPDGDDFAVGEGAIVVNRAREDQPVACGTVTDLSATSITVDLGSTSTGAVGLNSDVVVVPAHRYQVVTGTPNRLTRNGQLLASDVEDFQLTFFFDLNDDLLLDDDEDFGNAGGTAQPYDMAVVGNRPDPSALREVGVNIVTVTRDDDPNIEYRMGAGQITGNRTAGSLPSGDGKRRRVHSARVRLRNAS
ncbi:MAG: prepilin-type N-terminal cleavage/methylation domain-containing protein [Myxococcota bacterium]|nr:prepilin-type N-terminal cleavage/methylation domain-containing protein [Myxococcota bacterium]